MKKWVDVYKDEEEQAFFISLARNIKNIWRNINGISNDSGIPRDKVEKIIQKYFKLGIVVHHPKNDDGWAYWERVPSELINKPQSIMEKDQEQRLKK